MTVVLRATAVLLAALSLAACQQETAETPLPRPVRTAVVAHMPDLDRISLTGDIQPRDQVDLAFRVGGTVAERQVDVGDRVTVGQVVARLTRQDAENNLRAARAQLSAAKASLVQAEADLKRQQELAARGVVSPARNEQAQQVEQSARAQVEEAEAGLQTALDNLGYTELKAEAAGSVTAVGADAGEVVAAGQMVVQLALDSGRDAVFNVPLKLLRDGPRDPEVTVALADDANVVATGRVREVAETANEITGTYAVRVGLESPPDGMRLGATVIGRISLGSDPVVRLPAAALTRVESGDEVWVVDPASLTVAARPVRVLRYEDDAVVIGDGLADGEVVVTAGVHALRPGQEVRLLDRTP